jgi:hypothetical protein
VTSPFISSRAKLAHSEHHRKGIESEIEAFAKSQPFTLRSEHNLKASKGPIRFSYFVATATDPPEPWALVAGDVIQNIRAALDHAIWEIVVKKKGPKFAQANAPKIDFPIVDDSTRFPKPRLVQIGVPDRIITVIEDAQPYVRQKDAPRDDALWLIRALSNVDKHRLLHVISCIPEEAEVTTTPFLANGIVRMIAQGPLRKGTEVVRFTAARPPAYTKVDVQLDFRAGISFEATPETKVVPIALALQAMTARATEVVSLIAETF